MDSLKELCEAVLANIESKVSTTIYKLWYADLKIISLSDEEALFSINSEFKKDLIEKRHMEFISSCLSEVIGFKVKCSIVFTPEKDGFHLSAFASSENDYSIEEKEPLFPVYTQDDENEPDIATTIESHMIVEEYTFDNFIVGDSNKFAHAACTAVANQESSEYNPLFIWGQSGLGKTHLLYAVTNEIKRTNPAVKIIYKKCEEFTNELISAISTSTTSSFREKYRSADVLLIDDIQFIAGKESTQEEFFHTFTSLYEAGKKIILTSDRPPKEITPLSERLRTRFEWGLMADIQPPTFELRTAIIMKKAESLNINISPEIVNYLAEKLNNNIRQIEGAIKKINAISVLTATPITLAMCKRATTDFLSGSNSVSFTVDKIFNAVSQKYNIPVEDIKSAKRNEMIASARHICIYLIRTLTDLPQTEIGKLFSRNHATVIASLKKVEKDIKEKKNVEYDIEELINTIRT